MKLAPKTIEFRVPGRTIKTLLDWSVLPPEMMTSVSARITMMVRWIGELERAKVEELIMEGHNRIEVQVEGQPTLVYTAPSRLWEPAKRLKVWRARRKAR